MPPVLSKPVSIDPEWAASLVGLRMKVPKRWWDGCTGNKLFHGEVTAIDFTDGAERYFKFRLDSEKGSSYPMRYDAILHYADDEHPRYSAYLLPSAPPAAPVLGEGARVRRQRQRQPIFCEDFSNEDEDEDGQPCRRNKRKRNRSESEQEGNAQLSLADANAGAELWEDYLSEEELEVEEDESEENDSEEDEGQFNIYKMTDPEDWRHTKSRTKPREVAPIPYTGESEEFGVDITKEELASLKDKNGDIRFYKVMEWCLPSFDGKSF